MSILADFDPLSTNICISSALDQKRLSYRLEKNVQWRKRSNKMTECIFNALAFLFTTNITAVMSSIVLISQNLDNNNQN